MNDKLQYWNILSTNLLHIGGVQSYLRDGRIKYGTIYECIFKEEDLDPELPEQCPNILAGDPEHARDRGSMISMEERELPRPPSV